MMKTYAYIHNGIVWEVISPATDLAGNEIPISDRFSSEYVSSCIDITSASPRPVQGWAFDGKNFSAPK